MTDLEIKKLAQELAKELSTSEVELVVSEEEVNGGKYNTLLFILVLVLTVFITISVFTIATLGQVMDTLKHLQ